MRATRLASAVVAAALLSAGPARADDRTALIAATKAAIAARFADSRVAERAGYRPQPSDWSIVHYVNDAYVRDAGAVDPRHPAALVYERQSGGQLRLVAAMFMMRTPDRAGVAIGGSRAGWHTHTSCFGDGGIGIPVPGGPCPPGTGPHTTASMLHVWFVDVPGGAFAADMSPLRCSVSPV